MFSLKEVFYVALGLLLMAFGVMPFIMGEIKLLMLPVSVVLLVIGGYLARRGAKSYFQRVGGPSLNICPECGEPLKAGELFCGNCGASVNIGEENRGLSKGLKGFTSRVLKSARELKKGSGDRDYTSQLRIHKDRPIIGKIIVTLGTLIIIISGFLPWAKSQTDTLKGFGDPVLYVIIFIAIAALIIAYVKCWYVIPLLAGVVATAFGVWVRNPEKLISFMRGFSMPEIKFGLYVYILGSLILLIGGILGLMKK